MLKWYGDAIKKKVQAAQRKGINETMAACLREAKSRVPVRTGLLQGSLRMTPATIRGNQIIGEWGSYQVNYARVVEFGMRPHIILPVNKKALYWKGAAHPVKVVHHPGTKGKPYLRPAAEKEYPTLGRRIKRALNG